MTGAHFLLIDDHALFRKGLRLLLGDLHPGSVNEAESLEQALAMQIPPPDIILLDIRLPGLRGIDGIALLREAWPECLVFVVSSLDTQEAITEALACDATGYISKSESADALLERIANTVSDRFAPARKPSPPAEHLTTRQCQILELLCHGMSNKLIARELELSENTVRHHVQAIFEYFHVNSRSEATFAARRRGYAE